MIFNKNFYSKISKKRKIHKNKNVKKTIMSVSIKTKTIQKSKVKR